MNDTQTQALLDQFSAGDASVVGQLLELHRSRLKRMVSIRLNPRLRSRVGESDIIQETLIRASRGLPDYLAKPPMPFFVWLRWLTSQQIKQCHRFHLDSKKRDARQERFQAEEQDGLSEIIAGHMVQTTPSEIVSKEELLAVATRALEEMKPRDREILCMRHFEQMTNQEVAHALGIEESNASTRYLRALAKLQKAMEKTEGLDS